MSLQDVIAMTDYEPRPYSGRGMYGKKCLSVVCDDVFSFIADLIEFAECNPDYDNLADDIRKVRTDSLGLRTIVYWPRIKYKEDEDNGDADCVD